MNIEYLKGLAGKPLTPSLKKEIEQISKEMGVRFSRRKGCDMCYFDQIAILINALNVKPSTCNYELISPRGYKVQGRIVTNEVLTDELAEWFISLHPNNVKRFKRLKDGANSESI